MGTPFIVSVHVPKTAGTSLALILDRCFERRVMYDYHDYRQPQVASKEVREHADFIQSYFAALHGHFFASKYFHVFPDAAYIVSLRHPVSRVISQYAHELNETLPNSWYHDDIISGRMDIVEFAQQDGVGDAMSKHLAGRALRDYAALVITEYFYESCHLLSRTLRSLYLEAYFGNPLQLPILNCASDRPYSIEIDQMTRQAIFARTETDNATYAEAVDIFKQRMTLLS